MEEGIAHGAPLAVPSVLNKWSRNRRRRGPSAMGISKRDGYFMPGLFTCSVSTACVDFPMYDDVHIPRSEILLMCCRVYRRCIEENI